MRPIADAPIETPVQFVIHFLDEIVQEFPETYQLRLTPSEPLAIPPSVLFLDTLCVTIIDADGENSCVKFNYIVSVTLPDCFDLHVPMLTVNDCLSVHVL